MRVKHTSKKENRFSIKGITYEIGPCKVENADFVFEISSKIPQDMLPRRTTIEKYFREVVKLMNKCAKRPAESKMENIVQSTAEVEYKERDYVKLIYQYKESDLYTMPEVEKRLKHHYAKRIPIPDVPGIATPGGKIVLLLVEEAINEFATANVMDLVKANETVKSALVAKGEATPPPAPKKAAAKPKPKASAKAKPKAPVKAKSKPSPKKKKPAKAKPVAKKKAKAAKPAKRKK
ncbi:MAG: hypothetical protein HZB29_00515 [Nitrospinae bacterium]|nr:hypothetical protein [Nitrospinota bacterium]